MPVYDLILEEDHDNVRKKISEAEAKSLTRTTKLGKIAIFCVLMCEQVHEMCVYYYNMNMQMKLAGLHQLVSGFTKFLLRPNQSDKNCFKLAISENKHMNMCVHYVLRTCIIKHCVHQLVYIHHLLCPQLTVLPCILISPSSRFLFLMS